jgi:hypothetical protein
MKTLINTINDSHLGTKLFKLNDVENRVQVVDFISSPKSNKQEIILHSRLFNQEPVQIKTKDNKLILIVEELVVTAHNNSIPQDNWGRYYYHSYVRLYNISFLLPGENFFLVKSILSSKDLILRIILAQLVINLKRYCFRTCLKIVF